MARSFTGATDFVANLGFAGVNSSQGTISLWLKPNWNSGDNTVHEFWSFGSNISATDRPSFQKFLDNNIYVGFVNVTDYRVVLADTGLFTNGVWAHWTFTYTNGGGSALYKNGVQVGTHSGLSANPAGEYHVGINDTNGSGTGSSNSSLADFAVWDVVLSAGEISALASGIRPHTLDKQTILYLPLDGLASPEPDFSGGNNSATVTGTTFASGPPVALFTRSPALLFPSAAAGGVTITSAATIAAFTQTATLNAVEQITSNATTAAFTQIATLLPAGPATIASAATITPFTQVATLNSVEKISSSATIAAFTQVATLLPAAPATVTSSATIGAFTENATLDATQQITSNVIFADFTQNATILGSPAALSGGMVKKRHSKRFEVTVGGVTFIAPTVAALERKVAAWHLAHPANDKKSNPRAPRAAPAPHVAPAPTAAPPPAALPQTAAPPPAALPQPIFLSPLPPPTFAEGAAILEAHRAAAEVAQAHREAVLAAIAADEAKRREFDADDLEAIEAILRAVA